MLRFATIHGSLYELDFRNLASETANLLCKPRPKVRTTKTVNTKHSYLPVIVNEEDMWSKIYVKNPDCNTCYFIHQLHTSINILETNRKIATEKN